jgi:hypothetical protein
MFQNICRGYKIELLGQMGQQMKKKMSKMMMTRIQRKNHIQKLLK